MVKDYMRCRRDPGTEYVVPYAKTESNKNELWAIKPLCGLRLGAMKVLFWSGTLNFAIYLPKSLRTNAHRVNRSLDTPVAKMKK